MNYDPNQPAQYPNSGPYGGGYASQQPQSTDPYSGQQYGQQQGPYNQPGYGQPYGQQQGPYNQPGYGQQQNPYGPSAAGPSTTSLDPNIAAGLSYVAGWVTGLIFFLIEKQNRLVRFHAMQSILFSAACTVFWIIMGMATAALPFALSSVLSCVSGLVGITAFVVWIVLLVNAFQGKYFKLPIIGDYAERYANPTV